MLWCGSETKTSRAQFTTLERVHTFDITARQKDVCVCATHVCWTCCTHATHELILQHQIKTCLCDVFFVLLVFCVSARATHNARSNAPNCLRAVASIYTINSPQRVPKNTHRTCACSQIKQSDGALIACIESESGFSRAADMMARTLMLMLNTSFDARV